MKLFRATAALSFLLLCQLDCSLGERDCQFPLDVVAVVDGSDSILEADYTKLLNVGAELAKTFTTLEGQQFGCVVFSSAVSDYTELTNDTDKLVSDIKSFEHPQDGTATYLGIDKMTNMMAGARKPGRPQVALVITDGRSKSMTKTIDAATQAKDQGIRMFAVGVGASINSAELHGIASFDNWVLELDNFDQLLSTTDTIVEKVCIVDGGWSEFVNTSVSECSVSCDGGNLTVTQTRSCTNPAPENQGNYCEGNAQNYVIVKCNEHKCPEWSSWSEPAESQCSLTCGGGLRNVTRTRTCSGTPCEGQSTEVRTAACNTQACPEWSSWSEPAESQCSLTCGGGLRNVTRTRTCSGTPCEGQSTEVRTAACNTQACPEWSSWSEPSESQCSLTCGGGLRNVTRTRTCSGTPCEGQSTEVRTAACNTQACPEWSSWSEPSESQCSLTCGGGLRNVTRTRTCSGTPCEGQSTEVRTAACNTQACPASSNPCDNCRYENGVAFVPFPGDCHKYIQCVYPNRRFDMSCGAGLMWNQNILACDWPQVVDCTASEPAPAPTPAPPVVTTVKAPRGECKKKPVLGDNKSYMVGNDKMPCSPGTVFDFSKCTCDHDTGNAAGAAPATAAATTAECLPEAYLPFSSDDQDVKGSYVNNNNVVVSDGFASFYVGSHLRLLRYSNSEFSNTMEISFLIYPGAFQSQSQGPQAIVSNADCGNDGSIYILQEQQNIINFIVKGTDKKEHSLKLAYESYYTANRVERSRPNIFVRLTIDSGVMSVQVGEKTTSTNFEGEVVRQQCTLQIGQATGYEDFVGNLDELKVFRGCVPERLSMDTSDSFRPSFNPEDIFNGQDDSGFTDPLFEN